MALPVILGGLAVGGMIKNMMDADRNNEYAKAKNAKAFNKIGASARELKIEQEKTEKSLLKLANRKKSVMTNCMGKFMEVYQKIIKINFEDTEHSLDLNFKPLNPETLDNIKEMTTVAGMNMTTKEIISSMLFRGFGFKSGITGVIARESEINLDVASMRNKEANVIASQNETVKSVFTAIYEQSERFSSLLSKLSLLFMKNLQASESLIDEKGFDRSAYSTDDRKILMTGINIASTVKGILDAPIFDENGEISKQAYQALQVGESYLEKMKNLA